MVKKQTFSLQVIAILIIGSVLLFSSLGDRLLGHDELDTAKFARNLKTCKFPYIEPCTDQTVFDPSQVPNLFPRTTFYVAHLMSYLPGDFEFNSRFPFAILGLLSIFAFYLLSKELLKNKKAVLVSMLLYATSVIFVLHARSSRYYSLIFLFGSLAYLFWYRFIRTDTMQVGAIISLIALFYSHIQIFFYIAVSLFLYAIFKKKTRKAFLHFVPVGLLAMPAVYIWLFKINILAKPNMLHLFLDPASLAISLSITFFYLFAFFVPILLLFFFPQKSEERNYLIFLIISISILMSLITHNVLPELRKYAVMILPLAILFVTMSLQKVRKISHVLFASVLILLIFTNLVHVAPLLPIKFVSPFLADGDEVSQEVKLSFINAAVTPRALSIELLYELTHHYASPYEDILQYRSELEGKKIYSLIDDTALRVYLPTSDFVDSPEDADWIIAEQPFDDLTVRYVIKNKYSLWADAPDIPHHRFKTDTKGRIYILKKSETR